MLVPLMNATFMRRLTPRPRAETTRKTAATALVILALVFAGCATPGPVHTYTLPAAGAERTIRDEGPERRTDVPSFLGADDRVLGFAYDPFTDHFFLLLAPGDRVRVVDRPARAIKREFELPGDPRPDGDLALRPRDGHLFFLAGGAVVETTRLGKRLRTFALEGYGTAAPAGLAFDATQDRLHALGADGRTLTLHDTAGRTLGTVTLAEPVAGSLAYDGEKREWLAPLRARPDELGIFDAAGRLVRTAPAAGPFVDTGMRSLVRVF